MDPGLKEEVILVTPAGSPASGTAVVAGGPRALAPWRSTARRTMALIGSASI